MDLKLWSLIKKGGEASIYVNQASTEVCKYFETNRSESFSNEVDILEQIKHPNIVKYFGYSDSVINENGAKGLGIALEAARCNVEEMVLNGYLSQEDENIREVKNRFNANLFSGVNYLHDCGILHCD